MSDFQHSYALVIGINDYGNGISSLKTAVSDATEIAHLLETKHRYTVTLLLDRAATLSKLQQVLETELPKQIQEGDRFLFYFAGHGIALNGEDGPEGYLIPQNAKFGNVSTYLRMSEVNKALLQLPCRHFLGILDCCFAGAFRWSSTRKAIPVELGTIHKERYDRFIQDPAWQVLTSAAYDQFSWDAFDLKDDRGQKGVHSPFACALIEALEGKADAFPPAEPGKPAGDGVITASELYLYLRDRVEVATEARAIRQTPGIHCLNKHDKGEYIFLTPGHALNLPPAPPLDVSKNPYRGLSPFEEEHCHLFFGRNALTQKLYEFLTSHTLTVVLGASGSGKSSLVKAGLIPKLRQCKNGNTWFILPPFRPGESPFKALNNALASVNLPAITIPSEATSSGLLPPAQSLANWLKKHPKTNLLLVVDQFEELITLCRNDQERQQFIEALAGAIATYPHQLHLVLTLRSDFEPQFRNTALEKDWQTARFVVPAMTREELRQAIEEPASARVMYFDPHELVDQLIDEVANMPGALPLLSFALSELYLKYLKRQEDAKNRGETIDRAITQADYQELGGVTRSLTQRAEQEYDALVKEDPAYEQTIRHVMLRMVAVGSELARRRVYRSELEYPEPENEQVEKAIGRFEAVRLLTSDKDEEGRPFVEPAHDVLVRGWQRLLEWKKEEQENLILQRRITPAAEEWRKITHEEPSDFFQKFNPLFDWLDEKLNTADQLFNKSKARLIKLRKQALKQEKSPKASQFLWNTDPRLDLLKQVLESKDNWLNQEEQEFVERSLKKRRNNRRRTTAIVTGVTLGLSGLTAYAFIQAGIAKRNEQISLARQLAAQSQILESEDPNLFEISALLAVESGRRFNELGISSLEADTGLRNIIQKLPLPRGVIKLENPQKEQLYQNGNFFSFLDRNNELAYIDGNNLISLDVSNNKKTNVFHFDSNTKRASISLDLEYVALVNYNNVVQIVKLSQPQNRATIQLELESEGSEIIFSSNSKYIAIGSKLFELKSNGSFTQINIPDIEGIVFSPDGEHIAGYYGSQKTIWKISTRKKLLDIPYEGGSSFGQDFALSLDGKYFATGGSFGTAEVWDSQRKKRILYLPEGQTGWITAIAISSNGKYLALGNRGSEISVWDITTGEKVLGFTAESGYDWTSSVIFSPDGRYIAATAQSIAKIYSLVSKHEIARITDRRDYYINQVLFSPNSKYLITSVMAEEGKIGEKTNSNSTKLKLWQLPDNTILNNSSVSSKVLSNCESLISKKEDGEATIIPISKNQLLLPRSAYLRKGFSFTCGNSGKVLLMEGENNWYVYRLLNGNWTLFKSFNVSNSYLRNEQDEFHGFSVDDSQLIMRSCMTEQTVILNSTCKLFFLNINTGERKEVNSFSAAGTNTSFSGRYLASINEVNQVKIIDLVNSKIAKILTIEKGLNIRGMSFGSERYLAVYGGIIGASGNDSRNGFLLIYDTVSGNKIFDVRLERAINDALFHPSNQFIAAQLVGGDNSFRIWKINTSEEIIRLLDVNNASFNKSGKFIIVSTNKGSYRGEKAEISFLPFDVEDMLEIACSRISRNLTRQEWNQYLGNQPVRKTCSNL